MKFWKLSGDDSSLNMLFVVKKGNQKCGSKGKRSCEDEESLVFDALHESMILCKVSGVV